MIILEKVYIGYFFKLTLTLKFNLFVALSTVKCYSQIQNFFIKQIATVYFQYKLLNRTLQISFHI